MIVALAYRFRDKDSVARVPGWQDRLSTIGVGLTGKTLGLIGYGNIGREIGKLMEPFDMRRVAFSPSLTSERGPVTES